MKKTISLLFACFWFTFVVQAAETKQKEVQFQPRTFALQYINESKTFNCEFEVTHKAAEGKYEIKLSSPADKFILNEPLDLEVFRNELFKKLNKTSNDKTIAITEGSVQEVFFWLYSLSRGGQDEGSKVADVYFSNWVTVYSEHVDVETVKKNREEVKQLNEQYHALNARVSLMDDDLKVSLAALIKEYSDDPIKTELVTAEGKVNLNLYKNASELEADIKSLLTSPQDKPKGKILIDKLKNYLDERVVIEGVVGQLKAHHVYPVRDVDIKFERGYLNIQVSVGGLYGSSGAFNPKTLETFTQIYSIGSSSVNNIKSFDKMKLFVKRSSKMGYNEFIYLSDVLVRYDNGIELYTLDFSPADTAVNDIDPAKTPFVTFRKEKFVNLFESKIFTDLAGIREATPNGLVQVEVARRFNINNFLGQVGSTRMGIGFVNHVNVYGNLSKIENEQKYLPLKNIGTVVNNTLISPFYATNLKIRQHENLSVALDVNGFLLEYPDAKFLFYADVGIRYGHTPMVDSGTKIEGGKMVEDKARLRTLEAHSFAWGPRLLMEVHAHKNITLSLAYHYNRVTLSSNNEFRLVMSEAKSDLGSLYTERKARKYHMFEGQVRIITSSAANNKIFIRARWFLQNGDFNTMFPQFQIGYAFNLFFREEKK